MHSDELEFDNDARIIALLVLNWRKAGSPDFDGTLVPEIRQRIAKAAHRARSRAPFIEKQSAD